LPPPSLSSIPPPPTHTHHFWNSFKKYHFCIYIIHVFTFFALYSPSYCLLIQSMYISVFMPISLCFCHCGYVLCLQIRYCDVSSFSPFSQNCFVYSGHFFCLHIKYYYPSSVKKCHWCFDGDCIDSANHFAAHFIYTDFYNSLRWEEFLLRFSIYFSRFCDFHCRGLSLP
jgi:hypothetical protein